MAAPPKVLELVERFERNKREYLNASYNETQVRREFVDPLFEALGWDVDNKSGKAEAYKDVIHEDALKIGATTKAPDYSFRIGGTRKFFLETKKPSVSVERDVAPAYQVRRYSWNADLPLAILTDFEEFAVYDCNVKPNPNDAASVARVMLIKYTDYAAKWDEIASVFSKAAIEQGSFDKFAEGVKGKRGTSEVGDEFLKEIESWREELAKNIALKNIRLSIPEMNFAVQKTIDRILFLRICEDRGIEPYGQLQELASKGEVYKRLKELFEAADEKYNSGLFHFREERGRKSSPDELTTAIQIDDKPLQDIIKRLYYPKCPYEFSVLGVDILGNVYEQFLGKVIRLTPAHRAVVEEKPEVKKAGGVYYTPKYIVDYIVENTVGKLVEGKTPKQVSELKVLDPACGSGSFLIGAYTKLLDYHRDWYVANKPEKFKDEVYQGKGGQWYLTTKEKKRILLNNIHGVDIDSQAVEVTKLNLLLKVLENENQDTLLAQKKLVRERALPDLDNNIKCGNSLIGPEFYAGQTRLTAEEQQKVNVFDWEKEFPFKFDAVIGNPPYIRIQAMKEWAPIEVEFYKEEYASASKGNYDIYVVFIEKGLSLLSVGGRLGFICPHKFFNAQYGEPLRKLIADGQNLSEIVHFSDQQVFEKATTYTCLLFLTKDNKARKFSFAKVGDLDAWRAFKKVEEGKLDLKTVTQSEWNFVTGKSAELFEKLSKIPTKLIGVAARIYQGPITSADTVFLFKDFKGECKGVTEVRSVELGKPILIESAILKRVVRSGSIGRYYAKPTALVLFPYEVNNGQARLFTQKEMQENFPLAWAYLNQNRELLSSREKGKFRDTGWYRFGRTQNLAMWENPKIMIPYMITNLAAYPDYVDNLYFINVTTGGYGITTRDGAESLKYLCALLNSRLLDFYLKRVATTFHGGYFAANKQYIEQLPIIQASEQQRSLIESRVSQIVDLHKRIANTKTPDEKTTLQRQIDAVDKQIDKLVYELYGLTEEEIKIVEATQ